MDSLNWMAIIVCTLLSWVGGVVWFGPVFGKLWMRIHHGDKKMSDAEMKKSMEWMWKLIVLEVIASALMVIGLACVIRAIPEYSGIQNAFMVWLGFVLPMTVSNTIWGGDKREVMMIKVILATGYRLVSLLAVGYILSIW